MKSYANIKFGFLTILIGVVGLLLRPIFLTYSWNSTYLIFLAGVFAVLFVYYLSVSISLKQHSWKNALSLVVGIIIIYSIINYGEYNRRFFLGISGNIFSLALISLTFNGKVKKWFISSKSLTNEQIDR